MKKFFFLALALAVCAFTFVSCEKEKDKNKSSDFEQMVVGSWQYTRGWDDEDKQWWDVEEYIVYTFDAKGNFTQEYDEDSYTLKYYIKKDIIYIGEEGDDWEADYRIVSISSDEMLLLNMDGGKMEFKKKR